MTEVHDLDILALVQNFLSTPFDASVLSPNWSKSHEDQRKYFAQNDPKLLFPDSWTPLLTLAQLELMETVNSVYSFCRLKQNRNRNVILEGFSMTLHYTNLNLLLKTLLENFEQQKRTNIPENIRTTYVRSIDYILLTNILSMAYSH